MASPPTYNVLLPVRNGEATIGAAMDSILGQSLPPSSISVVEDGSTDGTAGILEGYESKHPGTVSVAHTGSKTTDYTRIPRLLNMGLDPRYGYHMLGAGDCRFAADYAEIVLSGMEADPSVAVASGHYGPRAPGRDPRGAGRFVRQSWFFSEYDRYPQTVGFEPETVFRARLSGMSARVYAGARYEHLERLGRGHSFTEFGHSMRALGYHPLYALGRCALHLLSPGSEIPRRGALNMLWQYATYRPSSSAKEGGYYSRYPAEFRRRVRRHQAAAIRRRLVGWGRGSEPYAARPGRPFTVVVPFLDTPGGRAFASRSLPSAASLEPDEILVGVDAPAAPDLAGFLAGAAAPRGGRGTPLRTVKVERSREWRLHPARVVHECLGECRTDVALLYNIDTVLRRGALGGLGEVGRDGVSLVSFALRMRTEGPGSALRYGAYRARSLLRGTTANSGMFWLHLPDYFGRVDVAGYARIANGFDTYIFESLAASPGSRVVTHREIGADAMDRENGDLEWRQFGYGLWLYARRRRAGGRASALRGAAGILKHAAVNCHPYSLKGWNWARANPGSEPVRIAAESDYVEWTTYHEPGQVRDLMDWPEHGTGFAA